MGPVSFSKRLMVAGPGFHRWMALLVHAFGLFKIRALPTDPTFLSGNNKYRFPQLDLVHLCHAIPQSLACCSVSQVAIHLATSVCKKMLCRLPDSSCSHTPCLLGVSWAHCEPNLSHSSTPCPLCQCHSEEITSIQCESGGLVGGPVKLPVVVKIAFHPEPWYFCPQHGEDQK